jgi:hypothetical protein
MAVQDKNSISLGLGTLEFGAFDPTGVTFIGYQDVGAIKSEVSIQTTREVLDFETGRPLITILQEVIREKVMVKATLAEVAVATIKQALGQGTIGSGSVPTFQDGTQTAPSGTLQSGLTQVLTGTILKFGGLPTHAYIGIRFTHVRADGNRHVFEGYRASPMGDLTLPFRETDWNLFETNFRLLADTTKPAGQQYYQLSIEGND